MKGKREFGIVKLLKIIFSQKFIVISLLLLQIVFMVFAVLSLAGQFVFIYYVLLAVELLLVLYIVNSDENPAYKLAWIVPVLLFPAFGAFVYIYLKFQSSYRYEKNLSIKKIENTKPFLRQKASVIKELEQRDMSVANLAHYVRVYGGYPIYKNTKATYFSLGEKKFKAMVEELEKARHFIFMEYFIIDQGYMWDTIHEILVRKAKEGVEVRLLYDGMGTQSELPFHYDRTLKKEGIDVKIFNPFVPLVATIQNNRDHRKILVIDGHTGFTGGVNIADEYINKKVRFGHWKDTAVMLKGEAVWNLTMMFLQLWEITGEQTTAEYERYTPHTFGIEDTADDSFVLPFSDSPLDDENVGELVYMDIINHAKDYVYISTPYLIPDHEMITALSFAAKSGVDVRIIVPGIPDKWYVRLIGQSFYKPLIANGVKIYEYDKGFIHAKNFVSDDNTAVVGTINLDYRSLYLHFECAAFMYGCDCVKDIKEDFNDLFENHCHRVTYEECTGRPIPQRMLSAVLGMFAPLL